MGKENNEEMNQDSQVENQNLTDNSTPVEPSVDTPIDEAPVDFDDSEGGLEALNLLVESGDLDANDPDLLALKKDFESLQPKIKKEEEDQPEGDVEDPEVKKNTDVDSKEEEVEEEEEENNEEDLLDKDSIFFNKKQSKKNELNINTQEDAAAFIKKKFSIDVTKDPKNWVKFINSTSNWRSKAQQATEIEGKLESLNNGLEQLPDNIKAAIQAYAGGEDHSSVLESSLDFNNPSEAYDEAELINHYFLDKATELQEMFDEEEIDENQLKREAQLLYNTSEKLYKRDQLDHKNKVEAMMGNARERQESIVTSAEKSVDNLENNLPGFRVSELKEIRSILAKGDDFALLSIFKNQDGTFKEDAAEKLAFSLYGSQEISRMSKQISNNVSSKATKQIVDRADDKPRQSSSGNTPVGKEEQDALKMFEGIIPGVDPYDHVPKE